MAISEIEKLERRYADNPNGLTFAPLAEIHRKNRDVAKALELLVPGLAIHPDYIPASIVLGRCYLDLGDLHAAESAFNHVLNLDGENVIALKALADITERLMRFDETEHWLQLLLAVDRSNDEAQEQLERIQGARRQAGVASAANPDAKLATDTEPPESRETAVETPYPETFDAELRGSSLSDGPNHPPPPVDLLAEAQLGSEDPDPEAQAGDAEPMEPHSDLVGRAESDESRPASDESGPESDEERYGRAAPGDFRVELNEDIVLQSAGGSEFQVPNASEELFGMDEAFTPDTAAWDAPPQSPALSPEPVEAERVEPEPVEPEPVEPEPEADPMVTESMALLLLSQGHRLEALRVYRELESRSGDARLRRRIAELEEPPPAPTPPPSPTPAPRRSVAAKDTGGRSTREFFRAMLGVRPPVVAQIVSPPIQSARSASASDAAGAPTRPAHDSLSLSSVFGDEGIPNRPAVSAAGSGSSGGVSFDEFFNPPASGAAPLASGASEAKSDDLDQFHTWLQNLKR